MTEIKRWEVLSYVLYVDLSRFLPEFIGRSSPGDDFIDGNTQRKEFLLHNVEVVKAAPDTKRRLIPSLITLVVLKVISSEERTAKLSDLDAEVGKHEYVALSHMSGHRTSGRDRALRRHRPPSAV